MLAPHRPTFTGVICGSYPTPEHSHRDRRPRACEEHAWRARPAGLDASEGRARVADCSPARSCGSLHSVSAWAVLLPPLDPSHAHGCAALAERSAELAAAALATVAARQTAAQRARAVAAV